MLDSYKHFQTIAFGYRELCFSSFCGATMLMMYASFHFLNFQSWIPWWTLFRRQLISSQNKTLSSKKLIVMRT